MDVFWVLMLIAGVVVIVTLLLERRPQTDAVREVLKDIGVEFYDRSSHECAQHAYEEWPGQWDIIKAPYRFVLMAGGEQSGKSHCSAGKVVVDYLSVPPVTERGKKAPPRLYWLVGASYGETEREFTYLGDWLGEMGLVSEQSKRVDPGIIRLIDGTRIVTKSAQDIRTLSKEAPNGIVACEASQLDMAVFERLRTRATPKKAWIFLAGTFETGDGWYQALYTAWQSGYDDRKSISLPTWANSHLYEGGRHDPEILKLEADASDDSFIERIAGKPVPPKGLVFSEARRELHVRQIEYVPGVPVHIAVDPGIASAYAVVAYQFLGEQEVGIDEVYERDLVTEQIIEVCQTRPWWPDVTGGAIDYAAYQRPLAQPATVHDIWLAKTGLSLTAHKVPINDGTERLKSFMKPNPITRQPRIVWSPRCKGLLSELGLEPNPFDGQIRPYRWKMDRDGNVVGETPEDRYNHALKATIYYLVGKYGYVMARPNSRIKVVRH